MYELSELPVEKLRGLTPDTVIHGKPLRELECREIHAAFSERAPLPASAHARDCIRYLATIRDANPQMWADLDDDVAALLAGGGPEPARAPGKLTGGTREERGRQLLERLREALDLVDDVDDVAGKLPPELKLEAMRLAMLIWREVNRLPAMAMLPAGRLFTGTPPSISAPTRGGKTGP